MNTDSISKITDQTSRIISIILHPLLIPVYSLMIVFSAPTLFGYLPVQVKKLLILIVLVNNVLLPVALIPFFIHRNIISSWSIDNRKERVLPLLLTTILYSTTSFIIFRFPIPVFLKSFIFATLFISLSVTVVNFWWKISLHSTGAGVLVALVLFLSFRMYTPLVGYLVISIIAAGLVLSARIRLGYHNASQVWVGFLSGFIGLILFMSFF